MGSNAHVIGDLGRASEARREARSQLRKKATALAGQFVDNLRRGDSIDLGEDESRYTVESVTWRVGEPGPPDEIISFMCPSPENALVWERGNRRVVLSDPRRRFEDEDGVKWAPLSQTMFLSEVLSAPSEQPFKLHRPTDDELIEFLAESHRVSEAFQNALQAESDRFLRAVGQLESEV